jgi:hypothetical protein
MASCIEDGRVEAWLAFSFARNLATSSQVVAACDARVRDLGLGVAGSVPAGEGAWRVSGVFGETICHLVHPERGHWIVRTPALAPLGERVPDSIDVDVLLRDHVAFTRSDALLERVSVFGSKERSENEDELEDGDEDDARA